MNQQIKVIVIAVVGVFLFILGLASYTIIQPGMVGVVFNRTTGALSTGSQGLVMKIPFFTTVQSYPISLRTYTMVQKSGEGSSKEDDSIDLPSKEGQHIRQDISITYNTSPEQAANVFKSFHGADIEEIENSFVRRTTITVAQNIGGQMPLIELISNKRSELQSQIQAALSIELLKMGFQLDKVNLGAAHLPTQIEDQMRSKMAAQQSAQQAEYELQKQKALAQARVAQAEGEAKAQQLMHQSLTKEILEKMWIEKWNGQLPQYQTGNATPMLNLGK